MIRWAWLVWAACSEDQAPSRADSPGEGQQRILEEGTPDALGVLALLNDPGTTVTLLDIDAQLDVRAARNLVAHRDGADAQPGTSDDDLFETVAEVDAVPQVGDATLQRLLDYARAHGWIPEDEDFYGVIEGVTLTNEQAAAALRVANGESLEVLDDEVGLDARAAEGLVEGRPFATLEDVALVPYVGPAALQDLVDYGLAHPSSLLDEAQATLALAQATDGLWFMSESDYPLVVWSVSGASGPLTIEQARATLQAVYAPREDRPDLSQRAGEERALGWMFDRYTVPQDWWEDWQHEELPRWSALRAIFEQDLASPQVFRFGVPDSQGTLSGDIDIFVIGTTSDRALVGFSTISIET